MKKKGIKAAIMTATGYILGAIALILVGASASTAIYYASLHPLATINNFASSTLSGIGMAIGGCMGSALILRFKSAREFVRSFIRDLSE
jgi:hypothetical protein